MNLHVFQFRKVTRFLFVLALITLVSVGFSATVQALDAAPNQLCDTTDQAIVEVCQTANPEEVANTAEPSFVDATCSTQGYYTLPDTEGIQYVVGKNSTPTAAGTYFANDGEIVVISAYLTGDAEILDQTRPATDNVWTHTFAAPSCPEALGGSTENDTNGKVLGDSTTLADTGAASQLPTIAAIGLIGVSLILYRQPHRIHYRNR